MLSEHYDLALIEVRLAFETCCTTQRPIVWVRLEAGGETLLELSATTEEMCLPPSLADVANNRGMQGICMPDRVLRQLADALRLRRPGEPAWLKIACPTGHLPAVPWELVLQPALGVPLLRLPTSFVTPVAGTAQLNIALCVSEPVDGRYDTAGHLRRLVEQLGETLPGRTGLHVFTNCVQARAELRDGARPQLTVHEPDPASWEGRDESSSTGSPARGLTGRVENPWLRWVMDALRSTSIDVAHFACPGYLSVPYGALDLGLSPLGERDDRFTRIVTAAELLAFMTRVGAWGVGFTIPARFAWPAGIRLLAHRIAELNPGPIVVDAPHYAGAGDRSLRDACRLLFGEQPGAPPATPSCSVYVNPGRVREARGVSAGAGERQFESAVHARVDELTLEGDPSTGLLGGAGEPAAWVASNQRVLERWASTVIGSQPAGTHRKAIVSGLDDALVEVSAIVARHARQAEGRS